MCRALRGHGATCVPREAPREQEGGVYALPPVRVELSRTRAGAEKGSRDLRLHHDVVERACGALARVVVARHRDAGDRRVRQRDLQGADLAPRLSVDTSPTTVVPSRVGRTQAGARPGTTATLRARSSCVARNCIAMPRAAETISITCGDPREVLARNITPAFAQSCVCSMLNTRALTDAAVSTSWKR